MKEHEEMSQKIVCKVVCILVGIHFGKMCNTCGCYSCFRLLLLPSLVSQDPLTDSGEWIWPPVCRIAENLVPLKQLFPGRGPGGSGSRCLSEQWNSGPNSVASYAHSCTITFSLSLVYHARDIVYDRTLDRGYT